MGAEEKITLRVGTKGTGEVVRGAKAVKKSWVDTASKLTIVFAGASVALNKLASAMSEPLRLGDEYVRAQSKINTVLTQLGKNTDSVRKSLTDYAAAQSLSSEYSENQIKRIQALSLGITRNVGATNNLTKAALAVSTAFGSDAEQAVRNISKTFSGLRGELGEQIPALRNLTTAQLKNGDAVKLILDLYGPQLDAAVSTASGRWNNLGTTIQDKYLSVIGQAIADNNVLAAGLKAITDELVAVGPNVNDLYGPFGQLGIIAVEVFGSIIDLGVDAVGVFYKIKNAGIDAMLGLAQAQLTIAQAIGGPAAVAGATQMVIKMANLRLESTLAEASVASFGSNFADAMGRITNAMRNAEKGGSSSKKKGGGSPGGLIGGLVGNTDEATTKVVEFYDNWKGAAKEALLVANAAHKTFWDAQDAARERAEELNRAMVDGLKELVIDTTEQFGSTMAAIVTGQQTLAEGMLALTKSVLSSTIDLALEAATRVIMIKAVEASASAASSQAGIPVVGPILAVAAAGAMAAFIKGLISQLGSQKKGFFFGGTKYGGVPGRDNQLTPVNHRETVRTHEQEKDVQRALRGATRSAGGSTQVSINMMGTPSRAETRRFIRDVMLPEMRSLNAMGY